MTYLKINKKLFSHRCHHRFRCRPSTRFRPQKMYRPHSFDISILDSFNKSSITTDQPNCMHSQLRHLVRTNELLEDFVEEDDGICDLNEFGEYASDDL